MTHVHFNPKKDSRSSPTTQTRKSTTPLMWFRLEECGLVKGSESQDLDNHQAAVTESARGHSDKLVETKINRDMHGLTFHKNQTIKN